MTIIASVVGGVILLVRKYTNKKISPKYNYIIWLVFIIILFIPIALPSRISIYNFVNVEKIKNITKEINVSSNFYEDDYKEETIRSISEIRDKNYKNIYVINFKRILANIWFIGFLIKSIFSIIVYRLLLKNIGNDQVYDERILRILERCKKKLKIKRKIKLIKQDIIKTPAIIGVLNIKILLTDAVLELDDKDLEDIFLHELSHYKRKDNIMNNLISIIKCVHWFNPFIIKIMNQIKDDIELATDEMATAKMDKFEKTEYCKVLIKVAAICSSNYEQVFGFSDEAEILEQRVDMIFRKEEFDNNSRKIIFKTIFIILLLWFVFYPTSYGMNNVSKLYLELEDGNIIEVPEKDGDVDLESNTIYVNKDSKINLVTDTKNCGDYIAYSKINLNNNKTITTNTCKNELSYFETGEYMYKFTVEYGKNKSIEYDVKIIVK